MNSPEDLAKQCAVVFGSSVLLTLKWAAFYIAKANVGGRQITFTMMRAILFLMVLMCWFSGNGQDPVYRLLTNQNGLPSNTVYFVLQDKKGYLWLGHDRGISRYDGAKFMQYKSTMLQGYSLSNLMENSEGVIWAQDFAGNFYCTNNDSIVRQQNFNSPGTYSTAGIIMGNLLVSVKYDSIRVLNTITKQRSSLSYPGTFYSAACFDDNTLFFISGNFIYRFDGKRIAKHLELGQSLDGVFFLRKTSFGFVAFAKTGPNNVYVIRENGILAKSILKPNTFIQEVNSLGNQFWISTTAGAYCFSEDLTPMYDGHCFFENSSISRIAKDREGSYWFATLDKGLIMVPNMATRLYVFNNESITALAEKNAQTLLAGTSVHKLLAFDTKKHSYQLLYKAPTNHEVLHILHDDANGSTFLCSDRITYLRQFSLQQQYMFAGKNVVPVGENWYSFTHASGVGFFNSQYPEDTILPAKLAFAAQAKEPRNRGRWALYNAATATLLAATSSGLHYYTPTATGSLLYKGLPVYASSLLQVNNEVFITTYSQGVLLLDNNMQIHHLTEKPIAKSIYKLQVHDDDVWMLSDEAVLKYNRQQKTMQVYSVADGLPKAEYKDMRWLNGQLYIATTQGLVQFDATMGAANTVAPIMDIHQVLVNGNSVSWQDGMQLASNQNNLSIGFAVLSYKNINEQKVEYRINDQPWQQLETGVRSLNLSALAPGKYTLQIQAANEDGLPAAQPLTLNFLIQAPLYRQWWFLLLMSIVAIVAVYVYFKIKLRREQRENALRTQQMQLEQELQRSKLVSIKSQMNPHFFFNALNTIQSYIYSNDKLQAANYLNQFSELTRMVLDMSNKDLIALSDELKALQLYLDLEALRFEDKLHYKLEVASDLQTDVHWLPPMLIQPYVENAIKHGLLHSKNKWELLVKFSAGAEGLTVVIDDNGVGRKKSEQLNAHRYRQHESFAMSANAKRLEILNKGLTNVISIQIIDKYDALGMAAGTTVELHVPAPQRHK